MIEAKEKYGIVTMEVTFIIVSFETIFHSGVLLGSHVNNTKTLNGYVQPELFTSSYLSMHQLSL